MCVCQGYRQEAPWQTCTTNWYFMLHMSGSRDFRLTVVVKSSFLSGLQVALSMTCLFLGGAVSFCSIVVWTKLGLSCTSEWHDTCFSVDRNTCIPGCSLCAAGRVLMRSTTPTLESDGQVNNRMLLLSGIQTMQPPSSSSIIPAIPTFHQWPSFA